MDDSIVNNMQLRHYKTIRPPSKKISKISAMTWSHNNRRLAVASAEGIIYLYDESGEEGDKFTTKSVSAKKLSSKSYAIKGLAFSPDDTKLAVAQTDNIVVYRIGVEWREKKSIVNRFAKDSIPVTCLCWPDSRPAEIVYGLLDGKVKVGLMRRMGMMKQNTSSILYDAGSPTVSLACSPDGHGIASGHEDGSIHIFYFESDSDNNELQGHNKITQHSCIPYCLSWGASIVVAGQDKKVAFYATDGGLIRRFDSTSKDKKEFSAIACNPSGHTAVACSYNRMRVFNVSGYLQSEPEWEEGQDFDIENLYAITASAWKPDGSRLVIGTLCGSLEMFDTCIKRRRQGEFEFTHVSPSQVIVKRLSSGTRIVLKSLFQETISKVNVMRDQYLIGYTPRTLLLGDLESCKLSEIPWNRTGKEKFFFDNPGICMVYNAGELSLIEYGINDVIGSFRTDHISTHLISARISEIRAPKSPDADVQEKKVVAYLVDSFTISILDLISSFPIAKINHDSKVDWLELNVRATKLLFRDKQRQLHLFDLKTQHRTTLLTYCSYVQWVPNSDVVVAQNRGDLCVWYSIDHPDRVTLVPIKGEVEEIVRAQGCTAVIVDEGPGTVNYDLDEGLIDFGSAIEDKNYEKAAIILEGLNITPETEAMWRNLCDLVLKDQQYHIAERCLAALGDVAQAGYLKSISREIKTISESGEEIDPLKHWKVRSKIAILNKDFKQAELILLEQGKIDEAVDMYKQAQKFEESVSLAVEKGLPNAESMKQKYIDYLLKSRQEDKAAKMYEKEGQYVKAINLYLQGGLPASAANVVTKHGVTEGVHDKLLDSIADALYNNSLYEKAAEFYKQRGLYEKSLEAFRKGKAFRGAVDLARDYLPDLVTKLEEEWGDWLVSQKQLESAVSHYIEAFQYHKAVECALDAYQWNKAIQIVETLDSSVATKYYPRIARHYEELQNMPLAKKYYLKAGLHKEAMEMFERINNWDEVQNIAESFMNQQEITELYTNRATNLENRQKFKEAEKLFIKADEPDLAINMYRKNHMFDDMIRLVTKYRANHLNDAHIQIAKQLEREGQLRQAEHHYLEANDWTRAVTMYKNNDKWDEAIRVSKVHGPPNSWKKTAWDWANAIGGDSGGEAGAKLLQKLGLIDECLDYCTKRELWDLAFDLARTTVKSKLSDVHIKYAMFLEDRGKLKEAEEEYLNGQSPKEAVEMYVHQRDWNNAIRVAETHDPPLINYIVERQASYAFEDGDFVMAEKLYIKAKKPELIIQKYKEAHKFQDAKRLADQYLNEGNKREVTTDWIEYMETDTNDDPAAPARMFAQSGEYAKAIDAYINFEWKSMSPEYLEAEYLNAAKIAANHIQGRLPDLLQTLSQRLTSLKKYKAASNMYVSVGSLKEGVEILVNYQMWQDAFAVSKQNTNLYQWVQLQQKKFLQSSEHPEDLIQGGNIDAAIESYANRQEWELAIKLAQEHSKQEAVSKYTAIYSSSLINDKQYVEALQILEKYGLPLETHMIPKYIQIVEYTLWTPDCKPADVQRCKEMLASLTDGFQQPQTQQIVDSDELEKLQKLYQICHLLSMKTICQNNGLNELYTKICVSLVRYCDAIPPDVVLYEAGTACAKQGWKDMAYVFYSRCMDIRDLIAESDGSFLPDRPYISRYVDLDNTDYLSSDIPYHVPLPTHSHLDDEKDEQMQDFCLMDAMEDGDPVLRTKECEECMKSIYEACVDCPTKNCSKHYDGCIITGYPVQKKNRVQCTNCKKPSNRNDWNTYIMKCKTCPNCADLQLTH
jgi:intraflagellar transport protein 172